MTRRVVISGMGIYSCIGENRTQVLDSLFNGRSGIGTDPERKEFGYRSSLVGILRKPELKSLLTRHQRLYLPEEGQYAYMASREALEQALIDADYLKEHETGIIYGNDSSARPIIEGIDIARTKKSTAMVGSGNVFQVMNSTITMNLSTIFNLRGINFTISSACSSGTHSVGMAYLLIKNGYQERIICGGAEEVNLYSAISFDAINAFSTRETEPQKASRPFDRNRDGLVPSGGAATLVLETYESALKRGAPILAEIIGYGFSSDGNIIYSPNVDGPAQSIMNAIKDAGLNPGDIEYINAHATSTQAGDAIEAKAIHRVFSDSKPYVSSTKSQTGHEMWMSGASEIIYSTLMMRNGFIAPNLNFEEPDEDSAGLNISGSRVDRKFKCFLSNSFGFGGTNASIVIKEI